MELGGRAIQWPSGPSMSLLSPLGQVRGTQEDLGWGEEGPLGSAGVIRNT